MKHTVLVIDEGRDIRHFFSRILESNGCMTYTAETGETGLQMARAKIPDLITTGLNLPEMSGVEVCQALKRDPHTCSIPILIVTSNHEKGQEIIALELGADAYLTKPVEATLLLAHVHALLRRGPYLGVSPKILGGKRFQLDTERKIVSIDNVEFANLTPKEFDLLYCLVRNNPKPLKREILYRKVWAVPPVSKSLLHTVDVHVQRIRFKLRFGEQAGILSVSGRGYVWAYPQESPPLSLVA